MPLSLPSEVDFLRWVVGSDWPEADEDALRRCAEAWRVAAEQIRVLVPEAASAGARTLLAVDGEVAERFVDLWGGYTSDGGYLPTLAAICDELARSCDTTATEVEYAKYQFIFALVALAASIAIMLAMVWAGGVSASGIPIAIAATQITVRIIAMRLLQAIVFGVVSNLAVDAAAQLSQTMKGTRDRWDLAKSRRAAEDGAIFGAVGGGVFLAGARLTPGLLSTGYGQLGALGVTGAVGGVTAPLAHGEIPTGTDVLMALTSGLAGGLGPDLARGGTHVPAVDLAGLDTGALAEGLVRAFDGPLLEGGGLRVAGDDADPGGLVGSIVDSHTTRSPDGILTDGLVDSGDPPSPLARPPDPGQLAGGAAMVDVGDATAGRLLGPAVGTSGETPVPHDTQGRELQLPRAAAQDRIGPTAARVDLLAPAVPVTATAAPVAGPAAPVAGPAVPVAGPAAPVAGPAVPVAGPAVPVGGPVTTGPSGSVAATPAASTTQPAPGVALLATLAPATPAGLAGIRLSDATVVRDPAGDLLDETRRGAGEPFAIRPGELHGWELTSGEAIELVRTNLFVTDAGLAFYAANDDIRAYAAAVHPAEGFVTLDLHGSPDGFEIDGARLRPEQFAAALRRLREDGVLDLPPGVGIKLLSCDTGVGGSDSPAAKLARELGVEVVAPDQLVWTTPDGDEIVASAVVEDGRWLPAHPADGSWQVFAPPGHETKFAGDPRDHGRGTDHNRHANDRWADAFPRGPDGAERSWAHGDWPIGPGGRPSQADELRDRRNEARADLTLSAASITDLVRSASSIEELLDRGVRPAEVVANLDESALARLAPTLAPDERAALHEFVADQRVREALRRSYEDTSGAGREILAETLLRQLFGSTNLVRVMLGSEVLMHSLTQRPATMSSLMRHPRAVQVLGDVVDHIRAHGVAAALRTSSGWPKPTPLAAWQHALSGSVRIAEPEPSQPGFEPSRRGKPGYVATYLRELFDAAREAQRELDAVAADVAEMTRGEPGWREHPKEWQRVVDKAQEKGRPDLIHDLAGAKIQYGSLADLYRALEKVVADPRVGIVALVDRFVVPRDSGYRDIQMKLRMSNGHIAELRLHLRALDDVAAWEHSLYEVRRDLRAVDGLPRAGRSEAKAIANLLRVLEQREFWTALQPGLAE